MVRGDARGGGEGLRLVELELSSSMSARPRAGRAVRLAANVDPLAVLQVMTIQHIVAFKYKETTTAETRAQISNGFLALKTDCLTQSGSPYIQKMVSGKQDSVEGMSKGLDVSRRHLCPAAISSLPQAEPLLPLSSTPNAACLPSRVQGPSSPPSFPCR